MIWVCTPRTNVKLEVVIHACNPVFLLWDGRKFPGGLWVSYPVICITSVNNKASFKHRGRWEPTTNPEVLLCLLCTYYTTYVPVFTYGNMHTNTYTCTHTKTGIKIILQPHPVFNFFYSQNQTLCRESWLPLLHSDKAYHYLGRVCTSLLGDARLSLNQES